MDFDEEIDFDFDFDTVSEESAGKKRYKELSDEEKEKAFHATKAAALKRREKIRIRRYKGEGTLSDLLDWRMQPGYSYHCISNGDIDVLSYLRLIARQQKIKYCLLTTWRISQADAEEIKSWIDKGYLGRADFYIGEIFMSRNSAVYEYIHNNCLVPGARCCTTRNHAKVIAGFGEKFDFAIESSANINSNPRIEQTVVTLDSELAEFYKDYFDELNPFNYQDCEKFEKFKL